MKREYNYDASFSERLGIHMFQVRNKSGHSIEWMAEQLGVAKKTVSRWERGDSCPTIEMQFRYFGLLGYNPVPYLLMALYPADFYELDGRKDDEQVNRAYDKLTSVLPTEWKRDMLYILMGNHGSSPYGLLQLMIAHLHIPLRDRVTTANVVIQNYKIHEQMNTLINPETVLPNMGSLEASTELAVRSAIKGYSGYACDQTSEEAKKLMKRILTEQRQMDVQLDNNLCDYCAKNNDCEQKEACQFEIFSLLGKETP